jgi:ABC-type branched-subunit amino acid transport system ATPase component
LANDRDHGGGPGLLATRRLSVYYDQFQAVREVDFSIGAGEIVALIGANGAGKSSFLKAIVGLRSDRRRHRVLRPKSQQYVDARDQCGRHRTCA